MGKIYTSMEDYERAFEDEFKNKIEEIAYYQGDQERTTIDGEWTEEELKDDVYSEALKILNGDKQTKGWLELNKGRALKDTNLDKPEFIVTNICDRFDLVEVYNRAYDIHKNDKPRLFGIHYFDELARADVKKVLKENLVTQ